MVEKLRLPFPLLSDARGEVIQRYGLWNADEHIAFPAILVIDSSSTIRYRYVGNDFADRPPDTEIFETLAATPRGVSYHERKPEIRVTADEARESIGPNRRAITMQELLPYYRGVFFATVALKQRFASLGDAGREALREAGRYQRMVREFQQALEATAKLER